MQRKEGQPNAGETRHPFAGFRGGGGGGFDSRRSGGMMSTIFGGRDPFDDPFFTRPFGTSLFGSSFADPFNGDDIAPAPSKSQGLVIKELNSDGEEEEDEQDDENETERNNGQSLTERKGNDVIRRRNEHEKMVEGEQRVQSFSYRKVTYGGVDGAYRTTTVSRRTDNDGVMLEESKAADKTTGQAEHRILRGIQNKGHSVTKMLKPDGKVETVQTLHNINQDELAGFEESWKDNAHKQISQWEAEKEAQRKHNFATTNNSGWTNRPNWVDRTCQNPVVSNSRANDGTKTSSSGVRPAKKVVRIPIE